MPSYPNESGGSLGDSVAQTHQTVRRWWWLLLPPIALAIGAAVFFTSTATEVYSAEAEVIIRTEESANLFPLGNVESLVRSPSAEAGFLESTEYVTRSMEASDSDVQVVVDVGDVGSRVEPSFIGFRARANDPDEAARAAQGWAETYIELRQELDAAELTATTSTLDNQLDALADERSLALESVAPIDRALQQTNDSTEIARLTTQRLVLLQSLEPALAPLDAQTAAISTELAELRLIEDFLADGDLSARINRTATVPTDPVAPSLLRNLIVALFIATIIGVGLIILAAALDDRARDSSEVIERVGMPCLAVVPFRRSDQGSVVPAPGPMAEAFHRLTSGIKFSGATGSPPQVIMFTSATESESKTTTASRLAVTLSRQGRRTLVIGADLRRPKLGAQFGIHRGSGLAEVLSGLYGPEDVISEVEGQPGLFVLRAGTVPNEAAPADLFRTGAFATMIEGLRSEFDTILIDCPPVLPVVDALEIAQSCDGIVLGVFAGRSRLAYLERALEMIVQSTATPLLGFVLTGVKRGAEGYGYASSYYEPTTSGRSLVDVREMPSPAVEIVKPEQARSEVVAEPGRSSSLSLDEVVFESASHDGSDVAHLFEEPKFRTRVWNEMKQRKVERTTK